ncbi:MAG: hypothetical protein QOE00_791, partial [Ilumatobacteraceae bacterium]
MWLTQRRESRPWLPRYVTVLAIQAAAMAGVCWLRFGAGHADGRWSELGMLSLALCLCEMKPISVLRDHGVDDVVASTTFAFAIFLAFGPVAAMSAQALASIIADA